MREETRKLVMDLIIQGIHRNADRIFDLSQNTKKGYVPVVTGTLKKSGVVDKTANGAIIGYQADYSADVEFGRDARPIEPGEQIVHRKAHKRKGYVTKKGIEVHASRVKASEVKYVGKRLIAIRPKTKGSREPAKNRKPIFRVISSYAATRPQLFLTRAVRDGLPFIGKDIKFFLDRI